LDATMDIVGIDFERERFAHSNYVTATPWPV
jgi:hypothetical protein